MNKKLWPLLGSLALAAVLIGCETSNLSDEVSKPYDSQYNVLPDVTVEETAGLVPAMKKPGEGTWKELSPIPVRLEGASVAVVKDTIIVATGYTPSSGDVATTRMYDISLDMWLPGPFADAPGASSEGAGVSYDGLFYHLGGREFGARNDLWSYDPDTDLWTVLPSMSAARAGLAVAVVDDMIFAIGGRTGTAPCDGTKLASVEMYDVSLGVWTSLSPMPEPRSDLAAARVGSKIYTFGGCSADRVIVDDVWVYDTTTDTWDTSPTDMPTARYAFYAVETKGGTVHVIGGTRGADAGLDENWAYKVSQDEWYEDTPMLTARGEVGAVGHGGRIYVVGGATPFGGASVDNVEVFKASGAPDN